MQRKQRGERERNHKGCDRATVSMPATTTHHRETGQSGAEGWRMRMEWLQVPGPPRELEAVMPASRRRMADRGHTTTVSHLAQRGWTVDRTETAVQEARMAHVPQRRDGARAKPEAMETDASSLHTTTVPTALQPEPCPGPLRRGASSHAHRGSPCERDRRREPSPQGNERPSQSTRVSRTEGSGWQGRCQQSFPSQESLDDVESNPSSSPCCPSWSKSLPAGPLQATQPASHLPKGRHGSCVAVPQSTRAACTVSKAGARSVRDLCRGSAHAGEPDPRATGLGPLAPPQEVQ